MVGRKTKRGGVVERGGFWLSRGKEKENGEFRVDLVSKDCMFPIYLLDLKSPAQDGCSTARESHSFRHGILCR